MRAPLCLAAIAMCAIAMTSPAAYAAAGDGARTQSTQAPSTLVSGPLSNAVANSPALRAGYLGAIDNRDIGFHSFVWDAFDDTQSYAVSGSGKYGLFSVAGTAVHARFANNGFANNGFIGVDQPAFALRDMRVNAAIAHGIDLSFGLKSDMAQRFSGLGTRSNAAFNGLFLSASAFNTPYAALSDGGHFVGATIALADNLHFKLAQSSVAPLNDGVGVPNLSALDRVSEPSARFDRRRADTTSAAVTWKFANWGALGLTASQTTEHNGLLGGVSSGALNIANSAQTNALGLSANVGLGDGWVTTMAYSEGITQLNLRPDNGLFSEANTLHSRAFGVAVAKHGLFGDNDSIGVALSRPMQVYGGTLALNSNVAAPLNNARPLALERVSLAGTAPQTNLEVGYVTTFFDGSLALQANAAYQMNLAGQSGKNAVSVISRAKINF